MNRLLRAALAGWLYFGLLTNACSQTDEIQVYDAEIAAPGAVSLAVHTNYTPSGSRSPAFPGGLIPNRSLNGVAEWAYGVTGWFEAGLYLPLYSVSSHGGLTYDGFKLRTLFVSPDASNRGFFYGVNFEFSFNTHHWDPRRYTNEIRPIIGAHFGRFDLVFNPIVDNSYAGVSQLEFVPATRLAMRLGSESKVAVEEYDDFGTVSHFLPANRQTHQLFLVFDRKFSGLDVEAGVGAGLSGATDHRVIKLIVMKDLGTASSQ